MQNTPLFMQNTPEPKTQVTLVKKTQVTLVKKDKTC
jgi:hypothetical protein